MKVKWKKLIPAVAIPLAVGGLSSLLTKDNMIMFDYVKKPPLAPPDWLFPVVWSILYILMGIASYLVCVSDAPHKDKERALLLYGLQLAFNFTWSIIFFNLQEYLWALVWLAVLLLLVIITTVKFFEIDKRAGYLLLPYIAWLCFAAYLNWGVYALN